MDSRHLEFYFFFVLFLIFGYLAFLILSPYFSAIVLAGTLAIVLQPVYRFILKFTRYDALAAVAVVALTVAVVIMPLVFFSLQIFNEATTLYAKLSLSVDSSEITEQLNRVIQKNLNAIGFSVGQIEIRTYLQNVLSWVVQNLGGVFSSIAKVLGTFFISLFGLFYLLKDGKWLMNSLLRVSPLSEEYTEQFMERLHTSVNAVVRGSLLVAVIQGIVAAIGMKLFGIPSVAFWGTLAAIASFIPGIGTGLVIFPAAFYLFFIGNTLPAFGLLAWGFLVVGTIDNFIRPILIEHDTRLHPFLILLSVLGGINLFGPIGFLVGPLVLVLLLALLEVYRKLMVR